MFKRVGCIADDFYWLAHECAGSGSCVPPGAVSSAAIKAAILGMQAVRVRTREEDPDCRGVALTCSGRFYVCDSVDTRSLLRFETLSGAHLANLVFFRPRDPLPLATRVRCTQLAGPPSGAEIDPHVQIRMWWSVTEGLRCFLAHMRRRRSRADVIAAADLLPEHLRPHRGSLYDTLFLAPEFARHEGVRFYVSLLVALRLYQLGKYAMSRRLVSFEAKLLRFRTYNVVDGESAQRYFDEALPHLEKYACDPARAEECPEVDADLLGVHQSLAYANEVAKPDVTLAAAPLLLGRVSKVLMFRVPDHGVLVRGAAALALAPHVREARMLDFVERHRADETRFLECNRVIDDLVEHMADYESPRAFEKLREYVEHYNSRLSPHDALHPRLPEEDVSCIIESATVVGLPHCLKTAIDLWSKRKLPFKAQALVIASLYRLSFNRKQILGVLSKHVQRAYTADEFVKIKYSIGAMRHKAHGHLMFSCETAREKKINKEGEPVIYLCPFSDGLVDVEECVRQCADQTLEGARLLASKTNPGVVAALAVTIHRRKRKKINVS